jgi:RNase P subunit RPR2
MYTINLKLTFFVVYLRQMIKKIYCSECVKRGYKPKMLGIAEGMEGSIRLWCASCRREIRVSIHNDRITTEPT